MQEIGVTKIKRIDALRDAPDHRLKTLTGDVLAPSADLQLQQLVETAAQRLRMPISLVSLLLPRTQFFRAQVGLPKDLAQSRTTDRDASFCQFVVRDGVRFEVTDAAKDVRVPQELVEKYGIRSYLGVPVSIAGTVVGSLCVIDVEARDFTDGERETMRELARKVSDRLEVLSRSTHSPAQQIAAAASQPAFAELKNLLSPLQSGIHSARIAALELRSMIGAVEPSRPGGTPAALAAAEELLEITTDLVGIDQRVRSVIGALEKLTVIGGGAPQLSQVIASATELAHHYTKLVGGVTWGPVPQPGWIQAPRPMATGLLTMALSQLSAAAHAAGQTGGIRGSVSTTASTLTVTLEAGLPPGVCAALATELLPLIEPVLLTVDSTPTALRLLFSLSGG